MANAELKNIPIGLFHDLMDLESLDLSGNKFDVVPPEILHTHSLKALYLDNNLFESLDEDSFAVSFVNVLVLGGFLRLHIYKICFIFRRNSMSFKFSAL